MASTLGCVLSWSLLFSLFLQSSACTQYHVVSGDTGYGIAAKLGLDFPSQLSVWNPGVNWNALSIGQALCASSPSGTTTKAPTSGPTTKAPAPTPAPSGGGGCSSGLNLNNGANLIGYWGQGNGELSLASYCAAGDNTFSAFHIAFLNNFGNPSSSNTIGMNLAGHCWTSCNNPTQPGLLCCPSIATDIQTCQSRGKKVLLSLGGAREFGNYALDSNSGKAFADFLWNYFLGGSSTQSRPFGSVKLDGIDLDIENGNSAGYAALVSQLRSHYNSQSAKTYYISGAPQCPYPDASLGPASGTALTTSGVTLDYVVVQFYNNGACNVGASGFKSAFNQWAGTSVKKVMVGFLGASSEGSGYQSLASLKSDLASVWSNAKFGGAMVWDVGSVWSNTDSGGDHNYGRAISDYLRANKCTAAEETSPGFQQQQKWLIPLIVIIAILLIGVVFVLFRKTKRNRSYSQEIAAQDKDSATTTV